MAVGVRRDSSIGASIRRRRLGAGLSVARLADEVGVRPSDIGKWERGESLPPPTRVRAMARVLGLDHATMLAWIATPPDDAGSEVDVVIDLAPPDPFVTITHRPVGIDMVPTVRKPDPVVVRPRPVAAVFPTPKPSLDADRHVYAATRGLHRESHPRLRATARTVRTWLALIALGIGLAWALQQLGSGLGDLLDLFGGGPTG